MAQANIHFEKATALDKEFADAYYHHSDLYMHSLGEKNAKTITGLSDDRLYDQMSNDIKTAIRYSKLPSKKLGYEFVENFLSNDWSQIPAFIIKDEYDRPNGWEPFLILISPDFVYNLYSRELKVDQFNDIARGSVAQALIGKNQLDSALALYSNSSRNFYNVLWESLILLRKKEYERGFDLLTNSDFGKNYQYILLELLAGKYQKNYSQLNHSIDSIGFDINGFNGLSPIQIYNAIGEYDKADALAHTIDERLLGQPSLSFNIVAYGLNFHLSATPNLAARLRELGIDPVQFEKEKYYKFPLVQLKH